MSEAAERMPEELRVLVEREVLELLAPPPRGFVYLKPKPTIVGPATMLAESSVCVEVELWPGVPRWADRWGEVWARGYDGMWTKREPMSPTIGDCAVALRQALHRVSLRRTADALLCGECSGSLWEHGSREEDEQGAPVVAPEDLQWVVRESGFGGRPDVVDMLAERMVEGSTRVETAADGSRRCVHIEEVEP